MKSKINIKLCDTNLITGSSDMLRQTLGGYYRIESPSTDTTGLQRELEYVQPAVDPMDGPGDLEIVLDSPQADMISSVVANVGLITTASSVSIFPYYTVPVSIIGIGPSAAPSEPHELSDDASILNSDEKWRTYIKGGVFNEVEYPGVYDSGPYNINSFNFELPYNLLFAKTIDEENYGAYEIIESKSTYNMYLPQYQQWNAERDEGELLNIYDLLYCTYESQQTAFEDVRNQLTQGDLFSLDTHPVFAFAEVESPALIKTAAEVSATPTTDIKYIDSYQTVRNYYYSISNSGSFEVGQNSPNLIYNKKTIASLFPLAYDHAENHAFYPFYNKIGLPRLDGGALNSLVVTQDFSDLLLNSIKDTFVSGDYTTSTNQFVSAQEFNALNMEGNLYEAQTVQNTSTKFVDFKSILSNLVNNPSPTLSGNPRFVGEADYSSRAALDGSGIFKHINKKNATNMLDAVQKGLLSLNPVGTLPTEITPNNYMPWSDLSTFTINNFLNLSDGDLNNKAECVAFRINKRNIASGNESNFIIQNQPAQALSSGEHSATGTDAAQWSYYDTQVKYGETYEYTTYAYFMVVGYQYKYTDLVLSRRISQYGQYTDAEIRTTAGPYNDFTCIEFYDPNTGKAKPSPMNTAENGHLEPMRISLLKEVVNKGYATAAQELAGGSHINFADFNIHIEPTIKIFEIQTGTTSLAVLDNPPPRPDVQPYQVKDQSQTIGFFIKLENPPVKEDFYRTSTYPSPINMSENMEYATYLRSQNMLSTDKLKFGTVSRPATVQIYRLSSKPTDISDFDGNLVATKSLIISQNNNESSRTYITPTCFYEERISTGHKFYYAFRFLNENNTPSPWSQIVECELIDDGGYKYANFSNIMESELSRGTKYDSPFTQFKKLLMLRPAIPQVDFNTEELDYSLLSSEQYTNAKLASSLTDSLWNKKYKIRLTSKKTGKKIDLNVNYKLVEDA